MEYITIDKSTNTIASYSVTKDDILPTGAVKVTNFIGSVGDSLNLYTSSYEKKSNVQLYIEGLLEIPEGYKLNDSKTDIVAMTETERITAGLDKAPTGLKVEDGVLVQKTLDEKLADGDITQKAYYLYKIVALQTQLKETDYIAMKIAEGAASKDDYADKLTERAAWRQQISDLQSKVASL